MIETDKKGISGRYYEDDFRVEKIKDALTSSTTCYEKRATIQTVQKNLDTVDDFRLYCVT